MPKLYTFLNADGRSLTNEIKKHYLSVIANSEYEARRILIDYSLVFISQKVLDGKIKARTMQ